MTKEEKLEIIKKFGAALSGKYHGKILIAHHGIFRKALSEVVGQAQGLSGVARNRERYCGNCFSFASRRELQSFLRLLPDLGPVSGPGIVQGRLGQIERRAVWLLSVQRHFDCPL